MFDDCVIMAGGSGTRLWPASNSRTPKQFLPAGNAADGSAGTFFSLALERAFAVTGEAGRVIVLAGRDHIPRAAEICSALDAGERRRVILVPEPAAKNTGPAAASALVFAARTGSRSALLLTSDHIIRPLSVFAEDSRAALAFAGAGFLVVFGIPPSRPETGYGYIEAGEKLAGPHGEESETFRALSFREKPDAKTAEDFVSSGRFYWNSGMFAFSPLFLLEEFRRCAPLVISPFEKLSAPKSGDFTVKNDLRILERWNGLEEAYAAAPHISFDYAVAEKCGNTAMVKAGFTWLDVGNWDEYSKLLGDTGAEVYAAGAESCFVDSDIPVALCGVRDLLVTVRSGRDGRPPAVLIVKKGQSQLVRTVVEAVKKAGRTELL
ncbi:MAG: mannose-1-phosphate guanylyltransferase [Treponema sp.]|jgi:mannose-1-phosphate guanylyltransferase/mannose-1-phosphate guanylyltransferase/mannose-6-phosphate isomerase|nr:mannose-1-phosphate guanylyltransferase [Treponema sp.]